LLQDEGLTISGAKKKLAQTTVESSNKNNSKKIIKELEKILMQIKKSRG